MKNKKTIVILTVALASAAAYKALRKKKNYRQINQKSSIYEKNPEDESRKARKEESIRREEVLEKILSDVEDMYRDREEIVPESVTKEEVPAPQITNEKKNKGKAAVKLTTGLVIIAVMTGTITKVPYVNASINGLAVSEAVNSSENVSSKNEILSEIEELERSEEEAYENLPENIAREEEPDVADEIKEDTLEETREEKYSEEDVYLLAQLIINESGNQERDGQIAVAEVVLNRLNSSQYPDTVYEVIYQPGQFSNNEAIIERKPGDEVVEIARNVLNGDLRVLNNSDVLYFRNPMITSGISPEEAIDWGRCRYFCNIGDHAFYLKASYTSQNMDEKAVRIKIKNTAIAYGDKVESYSFGGKPNDEGDGNTNMDLDCSGYVSWVLGEALGIRDVSTSYMGSANVNNAFGLKEVDKEELNIGDIGYRYEPGTIKPVNHCGIYLGDGKWIHCNSKDDGVTIEETEMFKHYYSAV